MNHNILIVDDEPYMTELIERIIRENTPHQATRVSQPDEVLSILDSDFFSMVFLDLRMPGMDGMELLREIKRRRPNIGVIMVSAHGTIASAVEALQQGAADFITKPFSSQELLAVLDRALRLQDLTAENLALRKALTEKYGLNQLIGSGPRMRAVAEDAAKLALSAAPVLLSGEFGTGKSFLARALHFNGARASGPFLDLDLASLGAKEMEMAIFGRRGANGETPSGVLARADGGTLHLAGIDRLPPVLQNRLADWLEQGRFRPSESQHFESADVRLLASSENDLEHLLEQGRVELRLDSLLGRFVLSLPPLRGRREDIPLFAGKFLQKYSELYGKPNIRLGDGAIKWLLAHDWPGNLRELENTIERAVLQSRRDVIEPDSLDRLDTLISHMFTIDFSSLDQPYAKAVNEAKAQFLTQFDERYLRHHLYQTRGDVASVQARSGLPAGELQRMMARTQISLKRYHGGK